MCNKMTIKIIDEKIKKKNKFKNNFDNLNKPLIINIYK
jgi:hypothetical protein